MERYIQPFIKASKHVCKGFLGLEIEEAEIPYFFDKHARQQKEDDWDISGVIGLTGDAKGAVVLSMKKEVAFKITDIITGNSHTDLDDDVRDAVGELVNIITGNAKQGLENILRLVVSVPTVIRGSEHTISWPGSGVHHALICVPFKIFENDRFILSVTLRAVKE
ncbi:MAG: chemotaxis protein CheX [Spirochaetaceae bacterium]|jgi:chemotaxis protein CheX|nr:chemotaxis protein CheX [Spirochaetaceae bacterium]